MPSQSAEEVLAVEVESPTKVRARLRLACGCTIERSIAADRILMTADGARIAVGKYPCPEDHAVRSRPRV